MISGPFGPPLEGAAQRISFNNEDNFVTNEATIVLGNPGSDTDGTGDGDNIVPPVTGSISGKTAAVTLDAVKMHLRIEPDVTDEDEYLKSLEMAAHIHTQNVIRQTFDDTVGEHVKVAMLLLIAHWYRNREAVTDEYKMVNLPFAYEALLSPERAYPSGVY